MSRRPDCATRVERPRKYGLIKPETFANISQGAVPEEATAACVGYF